MVKNLSAMQETWVWSPGWEDPLENGTAIYSSIQAWWSPWTEEPNKLQPMGRQRVKHDWTTNIYTYVMQIQTTLSTHLSPDPIFETGSIQEPKQTRKKKKKKTGKCGSDPILGECLHKLWYLATHTEWYVASQKTIKKSVREQILILNFIFNFNI